MTTKYDYALSQFPGKIIVVHCDTCVFDYDVREVINEVQHPHALHVMSFDCPKGHRSEARRLWKEKAPRLTEGAAIFLHGPKVLCDATEEGNVKSGTIAAPIPATVEPELGKTWCPNRHDSSIPPNYPALMFAACGHYATQAAWNEFCITCGVQHAPLAIYWRAYSSHHGPTRSRNPKNFCGYCGAKMVNVRAPR